jgi:hypothetical protein
VYAKIVEARMHVRPLLWIALLLAWIAPAAQAVSVPFVPTGLNPGDQYHVAFISFTGRDALSSDIADYNAFVQSQAGQSGAVTENWGVNWFAIASTSTVDAKDNIPVTTAPIYLLSDVRLADDATDLWDGSIQNLLSVNQFGVFDSSQVVWTGTQSDGTALLTAQLGTSDPRQGLSGVTDSQWVSFGTESAGTARAFYAVSEVLTVPEPGTVLLLGAGLMGLGVVGRPRRR